MNKLTFEWKKRNISENQTERDFLDFIIDSIPLSEQFGDFISGIGCFSPVESKRVINKFLLKEDAEFPNNRRSLYICPECGDLGCGAVSIFIERDENKIIWKDFAYENNYSDDLNEYEWIGPYIFDWQEYQEQLLNLLREIEMDASRNILDK